MRGRRAVGLVVVLLGLLAIVAVPNIVGRTVAGTAQAVPVAGPPSVGQCVGQTFDPAWDSVAGGHLSKYRYPELVLGDCGQAHFGEVVSLIPSPTKPKMVTDPGSTDSYIADHNVDACGTTVGRFLGLGSAGDGTPLFSFWALTTYPSVVLLAPTARQRAAGQHWLACSTYLPSRSDVGAISLVRYHGSLRNAESTGAGRDYLGNCPKEADWNETTSTNCRMPHHGEIFGTAGLTHDVARTRVTASCAKLVAAMTHNADLFREGRLIPEVQATDNTTSMTVTGPVIPTNSPVQCGVVTTGFGLFEGQHSRHRDSTDPVVVKGMDMSGRRGRASSLPSTADRQHARGDQAALPTAANCYESRPQGASASRTLTGTESACDAIFRLPPVRA